MLQIAAGGWRRRLPGHRKGSHHAGAKRYQQGLRQKGRLIMSNALAYVATLLVFLVIDLAWLFLFGIELFKAQAGQLLRSEPNLVAVAAFYVIYAAGITMLAVQPAVQANSMATAAFKGAVLGLVAYGTFDLTNMAIIAGWTWAMTIVDMAWGTAATAAASVAGFGAAKWAKARN